MPWNLNSDKPIFIQIVEKLQFDILSGKYLPGDKVPTVRELALEAQVNPNTMQKALTELEQTGLVFTQRTSGRYITEDISLINKLKEEKSKAFVAEFLRNMEAIGYTDKESIEIINKFYGGK